MFALPTGFVAAVLLYAAVSKISSLDEFAVGLPFGTRVRSVVARVVILTEFVVAVALLSGRLSPVADAIAIAVVSAFTVFLLTLLFGRVPARCQCFGSGGDPVSGRDIARNVGLIALLVVGVLGRVNQEPDVFGLLAGGTIFALVLVASAVVVLVRAGIGWRGAYGSVITVSR
jgi:uncharacterized membrane protein YphA (DoxX/SURF4 family)